MRHYLTPVILFALICSTFLPSGYLAAREGGKLLQVSAPDNSGRQIIVRLYLPSKGGPFPLVIVNHGSPPAAAQRAKMEVPTFDKLTEWLVERGYAVALPLRRGYGSVGGTWNETYGNCDDPNYIKAGLETANDIVAVIDTLKREALINSKATIVMGQSAGGWGTIALASRNPPNVVAYVNLSGGRGGHRRGIANDNCAPERLIDAVGHYGRTARTPMLWLYTENDSYFSPDLVRAMYSRFVASGGKAMLQILPPVGNDGHRFITQTSAAPMWKESLSAFLGNLR